MYIFDEVTTQASSPVLNLDSIMMLSVREPVQHKLHTIIDNHADNHTISLRDDVVSNLLIVLNERKKLH